MGEEMIAEERSVNPGYLMVQRTRTTESRQLCVSYLTRCKVAQKLLGGFQEALTMIQNEASTSGFSPEELRLLVSVITKLTLNATQRALLIKCLVPAGKMEDTIVETIGLWFISTAKTLQVTPGIAAVHWLIGLMDFGLVETKTVNTFYDAFFYILVKYQRMEPFVARLIYILTRPDDVSRRQVSRVMGLMAKYAKPPKHLVALLSLFKSYKPEHVPERIPSTNIESAWKEIPESLRLDLQEAARRCSEEELSPAWHQNLVWNPVTGGAKSRKKKQSLIPQVGYINIGSSISQGKQSKSIFEIRTLEEYGKHQLSVELPSNALSLLANNAGLHILTFSSADYQSRFCYNLYNTLQNAFIYEVEKYSYEERDRLLKMTVELCRYMQQEIVLVSQFLKNHMPFWNTVDHKESIFGLLEWITFPSFADVYNNILIPLRTMWECSSVAGKCEILQTLEAMVTNLYVKEGLRQSHPEGTSLFLGDAQTTDLQEIVGPLMRFIQDLIVSGLTVEDNDGLLLWEALSFYEQVAMLEEHSEVVLWTIAPPAVVYGGFYNHSIAIVSKVFSLLLRYRHINSKLRDLNARHYFGAEITTLDTYAENLVNALWFNKAFQGTKDDYLLRHIPESVLTELRNSCALDTALNISNHFAFLPHKYTMIEMGCQIQTTKDCIDIAKNFYPEVAEFLSIYIE